jgi:hypothetical protein
VLALFFGRFVLGFSFLDFCLWVLVFGGFAVGVLLLDVVFLDPSS